MKTITTEASDELAHSIRDMHLQAEEIQGRALMGISELIAARVNTSALVEAAKANTGNAFHSWWRSNNLPADWDVKYLRLAKTSKRLALTDKSQMRLIGIISDSPEDEDDGKPPQHRRQDNPFAWVKIAGKLKATLTPESIKAMDKHERETARVHLKPMVDLYNSLGG